MFVKYARKDSVKFQHWSNINGCMKTRTTLDVEFVEKPFTKEQKGALQKVKDGESVLMQDLMDASSAAAARFVESPSFVELLEDAGVPRPTTQQRPDNSADWPELPCYAIGGGGCGVATKRSLKVDAAKMCNAYCGGVGIPIFVDDSGRVHHLSDLVALVDAKVSDFRANHGNQSGQAE